MNYELCLGQEDLTSLLTSFHIKQADRTIPSGGCNVMIIPRSPFEIKNRVIMQFEFFYETKISTLSQMNATNF